MAKVGQKFSTYTTEFKAEAVRLYEQEKLGYKTIAKLLGVKSHSQIRDWVAKHQSGQTFDDQRGKSTAWRKGRPRIRFSSVEEELAYVKAERDYLKKRYPNLHGEVYLRKPGLK